MSLVRGRRGRFVVATSLLALSVAGCGSGLTAHPSPPTTPTTASVPTTPATTTTPGTATKTTTTSRVAKAPAPTQTVPVVKGTTIHVALSGAARSRHGRPPSGSATIQFLSTQGEVCWTFTKVTGVAHPTEAYVGNVTIAGSPSGLRTPVPSTPDIVFDPHYAARGCAKLIASAIYEFLTSPVGNYDIGIASGKQLNVIWGLL